MPRTSRRSISIAPNQDKPALSRGQKSFNSLIKQIESRRKRLADWETITPTFQQRYVNEYLPLDQTWTALQIRMVHCLDRATERKELTKTERRKIGAMIMQIAGNLIHEDEGLKAIYDKYSPTDFDSETAAQIDGMKQAFEAMFGVDLGADVDTNSPEDLLKRVEAHIGQEMAKEQSEAAEREARRAARKKTPKQRAAEARAAQEQAQISLSIREVYRKLASALHPDRETDPQERERKNKLMQRVNEAYNKNNLLQLLELQLELEHIDQHAFSNISEERLKHYNQILKEQIRELDQEILHVESMFRQAYGIDPFEDVSPATVLRDLVADINEVQVNIRSIEQDLVVFEDIKNLKRSLKHVKFGPPSPDFDFLPF